MAAEQRQRLLEAAEDRESFSSILSEHNAGSFPLGEVLEGTSASNQTSMWDSLSKQIPSEIDSETGTDVVQFIEHVATFGCLVLQRGKDTVPDSMRSAVLKLHDILLHLESESSAQDTVAKLCEAWYAQDCPSKREVVPQTILYLLMRSVGDKGKISDVKRVHGMREGLLDIEIGDESFRSVQESIMRASIHPHFILNDDGRRFLSFVLSLDAQLARLMHRTIKSQIPLCRSSMLSQYGEVYHAAWKRSAGPVLYVLEHECIQDLANHCIHARTPALAAAIRKVLAVLHKNKKFKAIDAMLHRVYQPILWSALKVANATVRRQAALLLAEAFPVQDPDAPNAEFEKSLNQQILALEELMKDPSPEVREVGVQSVSRVLSIYLDMLPVHTSASFVSLLVQNYAFDAASPLVRTAALRGLAFVLDNHLSHPLLKARLPLLKDLIHDKSERVRLAIIDLLLKVRSVRAIRYFDVVPMEQILLRVAADATRPAVVAKLAALLTPSFLPVNKPPPELLTRAMTMIRQNPQAAEVFYREAGATAPEQVAVNLVVVLHHALMVVVQKKRGGAAGKGKEKEKEKEKGKAKAKRKKAAATPQPQRGARGSRARRAAEEEEEEEDLEQSALRALTGVDGEEEEEEDLEKSALLALAGEEEEEAKEEEEQQAEALAALAAGEEEELGEVAVQMMQVMAGLMSTLGPRLEKEECARMREYLAHSIPTSSIPHLVEAFGSAGARRALWRLAAALPEAATEEVCRECLGRLEGMGRAEMEGEAGPLLECLVAWGWQRPLLASLAAAVRAALRRLREQEEEEEEEAQQQARPDGAGKRKGKRAKRGAADAGGKKRGSGGAAAAAGRGAGEWAEAEVVVWSVHELVSSEGARAALLQAPSQLQGLLSALAAALPDVVTRVQRAPASPGGGGGRGEGLVVEMLLVYAKLSLHCHSAQFPGAAGIGKSPDELVELLEVMCGAAAPSLSKPWRATAAGEGEDEGEAEAEERSPHAKAARSGLAGGGVGGSVGWQACRVALMVAADSCALNRADSRLAHHAAALIAKMVEEQKGCAELDAGVLHAICKTTYQLLRLGIGEDAGSGVVAGAMRSLPDDNLRGMALLLRETLALSARTESSGAVPGAAGARVLLGACLQRAQDAAQQDREEETGAERNAGLSALVDAAQKGGADVQVMLSRELAAMIDGPKDLSALQAALGMAEVMIASRGTRGAGVAGVGEVRRAVTGVLATLKQQPGRFEPGENGCNAHEVAALAETLLTASG